MNRKLRTAIIASFVVLAVAATLSLAFLAASQWWPGATSAHIRWGDHSTAISGVFDSALLKFMAAWAAITLGILISVAAILFAFTISAIARHCRAFHGAADAGDGGVYLVDRAPQRS